MTIEERLAMSLYNQGQYKKKCLKGKPKDHGLRNLGKETPEEFYARMEKQKEGVRRALNY